MTHFLERNLKQTITYWAAPIPDGWGGYTFTSPTTISARWEDTQELFVNAQGKEEKSRAVVWLGQDVDIGGYLYNGTSTDENPKTVAGAFPIKSFSKIPNIKATKFERKAWL